MRIRGRQSSRTVHHSEAGLSSPIRNFRVDPLNLTWGSATPRLNQISSPLPIKIRLRRVIDVFMTSL